MLIQIIIIILLLLLFLFTQKKIIEHWNPKFLSIDTNSALYSYLYN